MPARRAACRAAAAAAACLLALLRTPLAAAAPDTEGIQLARYLEALRRAGVAVIYSDALVRPWMVIHGPPPLTSRQQLGAVLVEFGLMAVQGPGRSLLIVRATRDAARVAAAGATAAADRHSGALDEIVVSASRYELLRQSAVSVHRMSAADIVRSPDVGDDPMRTLARLPGAAFSVFSAQPHFRGGAVNEILYRFDGIRLYEPFHLKDFQSVFSVIDPATLSGMLVYTGAFPARLGDRLSGVVELQPLHAHGTPQGEVSLSLFNVAALHARGFDSGRGALQLSVRRSVYDRLLRAFDSSGSEPGYAEGLARARWQWNAALAATAGVLAFNDDIRLADSDAEERARAGYRNRYAWLRLEFEPAGDWSGSFALTHAVLASDRSGEVEHGGVSSGWLHDRRRHTISGVGTDWVWNGASRQLGIGAETRWVRGNYRYEDEAAFDVLFDAPGFETERWRQRSLYLRPSGLLQALYVETRLRPVTRLSTELGLRVDRETLSAGGSVRLSPRASAEWRASEQWRWRASVGWYSQGQGVEELQVADG
ncbi:MAG: TonB-dependent receptor [Gammaproteobacteria bacterium]|nr:TonB-dependent receptor [Gammaproteobacteria bacterium]